MEKENRNPRPDFKLSIDTQLLIEKLRELNYGDSITYRLLSELIGRSVQTEAVHILDSAIRYLAREEQIFFSKVRGTGLQRMTESERGKEIPLRGRKKIRSAATGIVRELSFIPADKLSREEQKELNTNKALAGTIKNWAREKEAQRVIEAAPDDGKLSTGNIIDLLRKKAG
jgi:hypothetical protein